MNGLLLRLLGGAAASVLCAGCVSTAEYPDHWAEQVEVESGACPDIDGEYLNEGEAFEEVDEGGIVRHTFALADLACAICTEAEVSALDSLASLTPAYERFRLRLADEILTITATTVDGVAFRREQPVRARCSGSLVLIESSWRSSLQTEQGWEMFGTTLGMSTLERTSLKLGRAEDGSLLVRPSLVASLMLLQWPILPVVVTDWVRFPVAIPRPGPGNSPALPDELPQLQAGTLP